MPLSVGLTVAVLTVLNSTAITPAQADIMPQAQSVREYVEEYFADAPIMVAIAKCESQFRHAEEDGTILKNPHSTAIGTFQIMSSLHKEPAQKLGLDIYTMQGNAAYARYLYENQGTKPWNASKHCWKHSDAHLALASN